MPLIDINTPIIGITIGTTKALVSTSNSDWWAVDSMLRPVVTTDADTWSVAAPTPDSFMVVQGQTGNMHLRKVEASGSTYRVWLGTDPALAPDFVFVNPTISDSENPMTTIAKIIQKEFGR